MKYQVTIQRTIDGVSETPRSSGETRRFNGAINVRDKLVEATLHNQFTHNPDGRVYVEPEYDGDLTVTVTSLYPDGQLITFEHTVQEKPQ